MGEEQSQRNFRSYYYAKVGFPGVEEKKSLEILFKENKLDEVKLSQFCLRFPVPGTHRLPIWKVLLRVLPRYQSNHNFVWKIKCDIYEDYHLAILILQLAKLSSPPALKFLKMYLLSERKLLFDHEVQEKDERWLNFMAIAEAFDEICTSEQEAFWLLKTFYNFIQKFQDAVTDWREHAESVLAKEDGQLHRHLVDHRLLGALPFELWFHRCFAGILPVQSLVRIWDRLVGGAVKILPYVAVAMLMALRRSLQMAKTLPQALKAINNMMEETAEVVASRAIELWQKYGAHTNPGSCMENK